MKKQIKTIQADDNRGNVFASFTVAELKRIYNALLIDHLSDAEPDQATAGVLEKIEKLIPE